MIVRQALTAVVVLVAATGCAGGPPPAASAPEPTIEAPAGSASTPAGSASLVVLDCVGEPQVRPSDYVITCADANDRLDGLHWNSWGPGTAVATGHESLNDCTPSCAEGRPHSYPVSVTLSKPVPWTGHPRSARFTTLTLKYTGTRPAGAEATKVDTLPG